MITTCKKMLFFFFYPAGSLVSVTVGKRIKLQNLRRFCWARWLQCRCVIPVVLMVRVYLCFSVRSSVSSEFNAVWVVGFSGLIHCLCFLSHWASPSSCFSYWQAVLDTLTSALPGSLNCGSGKSEQWGEEMLQESGRWCRLAEAARKWGVIC